MMLVAVNRDQPDCGRPEEYFIASLIGAERRTMKTRQAADLLTVSVSTACRVFMVLLSAPINEAMKYSSGLPQSG